MWGLFCKFIQKFLLRSAKYAENGGYLVDLAFARKERILSKKLEQNTADTPYVHFLGVVSVGHEALRGPVPPCGNILGMGPGWVQIWSDLIKKYFCKSRGRPT